MSAFKGPQYDHNRDFDRLSNNLQRVFHTMLDGMWHTHEDLEKIGGVTWSRRVRDLRSPEWGPLEVEAECVSGGLWRYRLVVESVTPRIHDKIMNRNPDRSPPTERDRLLTAARKKIKEMSDDELRDFVRSDSDEAVGDDDFFDLFGE